MANNKAIVTIMLVSVGLSSGFIFWQRKPQEPAVPVSAAPSLAHAAAQALPTSPWLPDPIVISPQKMAAAAESPPSRITSVATSESEPRPVQVPVFVHVRNNEALDKLEGSIRNATENPMDLTIQVVSATTQRTSQIQLQLAPEESKIFGPDDGLEIRPHDQLILQSPPFLDRMVRVP